MRLLDPWWWNGDAIPFSAVAGSAKSFAPEDGPGGCGRGGGGGGGGGGGANGNTGGNPEASPGCGKGGGSGGRAGSAACFGNAALSVAVTGAFGFLRSSGLPFTPPASPYRNVLLFESVTAKEAVCVCVCVCVCARTHCVTSCK